MPRSARLAILAALLAVIALARSVAPPPRTASAAMGHGPTIVILHGLGSRAEHWLPCARLLARDHRVVMVDLPGHGASAMPDPFSLERATQALDLALAHEEGLPCILVGHSVGGLVAASEALEHPDRVRGLVLVETALKPQVEGALRDTMLAALDHDYDGLLRGAYGDFGRDSAQGEALYRQVATMDPTAIKPWIRLALTADLSVRAEALAMPVMALLAPRSWAVGEPWQVASTALGYAGVPVLRHQRIRDAGHFVMIDQPEALARAIASFAADPAGRLLARR